MPWIITSYVCNEWLLAWTVWTDGPSFSLVEPDRRRRVWQSGIELLMECSAILDCCMSELQYFGIQIFGLTHNNRTTKTFSKYHGPRSCHKNKIADNITRGLQTPIIGIQYQNLLPAISRWISVNLSKCVRKQLSRLMSYDFGKLLSASCAYESDYLNRSIVSHCRIAGICDNFASTSKCVPRTCDWWFSLCDTFACACLDKGWFRLNSGNVVTIQKPCRRKFCQAPGIRNVGISTVSIAERSQRDGWSPTKWIQK